MQGEIPAITDYPAAGIIVEPDVPSANISYIEISRLIVSVQSTKHYTLIGKTTNESFYQTLVKYIFKYWYIYWDKLGTIILWA